MYFVVYALDKPNVLSLRKQIRPEHQKYLRAAEAVVVHHGGPLLNKDEEDMIGTMLVLEAGSLDTVENFVANDPYFLHGLFKSVNISPWKWGLGRPAEAH